MRIALRFGLIFMALAVLISLSAGNAFAGVHPAYIHALSDLRTARAHLEERPDHGALHREEKDAISEINHAIDEIKKAAKADDKDLDWHPPVDMPREWAGRLRESMRLLDRAFNDVDREEDNSYSRELRGRALGHIDQARFHVREAFDIIHERYR